MEYPYNYFREKPACTMSIGRVTSYWGVSGSGVQVATEGQVQDLQSEISTLETRIEELSKLIERQKAQISQLTERENTFDNFVKVRTCIDRPPSAQNRSHVFHCAGKTRRRAVGAFDCSTGKGTRACL